MSPIRFLFVCALVAAQIPAQRTIVVDALNRPGTNFTDLPPAVASALPGDTIRLRAAPLSPGGYLPPTVSRGITILGEGSPTVWAWFTPMPFQVVNLPASETFVMKSVQLISNMAPDARALRMSTCSGRIHLENVNIQMGMPSGGIRQYTAPGLEAVGCAAVTLGGCRISGAPGLRAQSSAVAVEFCTLVGHDSNNNLIGPSQSGAAVEVVNAQLTMAGSWATAGNGGQGVVPQPALVATTATLTLGARNILAAGSGVGSASALSGTGGTLLLDPSVSLTPFGGAPAIGGTIAVTSARVPTLIASGAPPGGGVTTSIFSPANDLVVLFASSPWPPVQAPPFGELWLDPLGIFYVAATFQGPGERWDHAFPTSTSVTPGLPIALQGVSGPGLDLHLTTPCTVILH